jgi:peptidoglycan hydrolase-like protein with peptidoglycan-binding domain
LCRIAVTVVVLLSFGAQASFAASPRVAALQVALRHHGVYSGTVDGVAGPGTAGAVRRFQARRGLAVDGVAGPRTRRALGALGRHPIGSRPLRSGMSGWDVAALQFALAAKGFPGGPVDGGFGARTDSAVRRVQTYAGLRADGVAGPATMAVLRRPGPATPPMRRPINAPIGDRYGPRGNTFHAGLDFPAPTGATVRAAAPGRATFAGFASGWGLVVTVDHGGWKTRYAHLSRATVAPGDAVSAGERVGLVGSTGFATGPHLHFEVIVRGASVDPARGL